MARAAKPADDQETAWVVDCRRGNREAFRPLVERYQQIVFRLTLRMLADRGEAQDAAQDTFLKAYASLRRYDTARPFSTWLYRIAVNTCIDRRRQRRDVAVADLEPPVLDDGAVTIERREIRDAVHAALMRLPESYRVVLILKDIEGLDYQSIAQVLGGSVPALKIRVVRGRVKLAQQIRKMYPELAPSVSLDVPDPG